MPRSIGSINLTHRISTIVARKAPPHPAHPTAMRFLKPLASPAPIASAVFAMHSLLPSEQPSSRSFLETSGPNVIWSPSSVLMRISPPVTSDVAEPWMYEAGSLAVKTGIWAAASDTRPRCGRRIPALNLMLTSNISGKCKQCQRTKNGEKRGGDDGRHFVAGCYNGNGICSQLSTL